MRDLFQPTFRGRLRLFFAVIVIIPMIAVAAVLFRLVGTSDTGKVDAKLGEAEVAAQDLFMEGRDAAGAAARRAPKDVRLAAALQSRARSRVQASLDAFAARVGASRVRLDAKGLGRFESGRAGAIAPATVELTTAKGTMVGPLTVSTTPAQRYANRVDRLLRVHVVASDGGQRLATTLPAAFGVTIPRRGAVTIGDSKYRSTSFTATGFGGHNSTVVNLLAPAPRRSALSGPNLAVIGLTLGFLALAFAFALTVARALQAEIQRLLEAAQRLGAGDFSVQVPDKGSDEFAAVGREFNSMARQLQARLDELQRERARLQEAIRRVGESFARGLDREGLLEIVVQTAVDGVGAAGGRATMRRRADAPLTEVARAGAATEHRRALHAAEAAVMDAGQLTEIQIGGTSALAAPLAATESGDRVLGIVSVARADRGFWPGERELFSYLTNQAAVSVENVDLHETVQRQAVTDELTGLFNHRRFQEVMSSEVERARRFNQEMGLIMLDIDDFKRVNDTYGHMQGDMVLREVARVLRQSAREIDEPARYGGEEMAVALPQTDLEGAYRFAERVRRRIEDLELPVLDGDGRLKVTASFGAASLATAPEADKDALVAAADAALYRAKRAGKNRTMKAE